MTKQNTSSKRVCFVVAFRDFKHEEYFHPQTILQQGGVEVVNASDKKGEALSTEGETVEIDLSLEELEAGEYDGIFFIGGPGALDHLDNEKSYRLARETVDQGKILGAICISPVILAKAGILKDKKATVWSSDLNKKPVRILEKHGGEYVDKKVVKDGDIITADGPAAASQFGKEILDTLGEK